MSARTRWMWHATAVALIGALVIGGVGVAGKPAPPPPASTIFYNYDSTQIWAMNGDGSGKVPVFLTPGGVPYVAANRVYGANPKLDRWFLTTKMTGTYKYWRYVNDEVRVWPVEHKDLFLVHPALGEIRVTNFFGAVNFNMSSPGSVFRSEVAIATDGTDSFFSAVGDDTSLAYDPAVNDVYWPNVRRAVIYRFDLSIDEVLAFHVAGKLPLLPTDPAFTDTGLQGDANLINAPQALDHQWCPDGDRLVYTIAGVTYVANTTTGAKTLLWGTSGDHFRWSPLPFADNEYRLVFSGSPDFGMYAGVHGLYTLRPDGNDLRQLAVSVDATTMRYHRDPIWSPNGEYIVERYTTVKGWNWSYEILRIPSGGGTSVSLSKDLPNLTYKAPMQWVGN